MPRIRKPFTRPDANRDAKLIIVATEDSKATVAYFNALATFENYQSPKVHVEVLGSSEGFSAPEYVLNQLEEWDEQYDFGEGDEFWLVIDIDRWEPSNLSSVCQRALQKNYLLAVSNPCVELWFLLHFIEVDELTDADKELMLVNDKISKDRHFLDRCIVEKVGSFSKGNFNPHPYLPLVGHAIAQAKNLDTDASQRWPQSLGTHVYKLIESIIQSSIQGSYQ